MKLLKETVKNNHEGYGCNENQMHFDVCNKNESAMILM